MPLVLICRWQMSGHKNKNWPIKSAFFNGPLAESEDGELASTLEVDVLAEERSQRSGSESGQLLATGSEDRAVYVFNVGPSSSGAQSGQAEQGRLVQRLEGHKGCVYSVAVHPTQPALASCSADGIVKLWTPKGFAL
jgi:COMPASS component SWD3